MGYTHYIELTKKIPAEKWALIHADAVKLYMSLPKATRLNLEKQGTAFTPERIFVGCYEGSDFTRDGVTWGFHKTGRTIGDEFVIGLIWLYKYHCPHIVDVNSDGSQRSTMPEYRSNVGDLTMNKAWAKFKKVFPAYAEYDMEKWYFAEPLEPVQQ